MPDSNLRSFDEMFQAAGVTDKKESPEETKTGGWAETVFGNFMRRGTPASGGMGEPLLNAYQEAGNVDAGQNTVNEGLRGFLGRGVNAANMAQTGATMGPMGALAGAGIGMALPPSEEVGQDIGMTAGEQGTNKLVDMFMGNRGRLAKAGMNVAGTALGGFLGHRADAAMNPTMVQKTDYGPVSLWVGAGLGGTQTVLASLLAKPNVFTSLRSKADQIKEMTGVDLALTGAESRGPNLLTKLAEKGTAYAETGRTASAEATKAFEAFMNDTWASVKGKFDDARNIRTSLIASKNAYKKDNPIMETVEDQLVESGKTNWQPMAHKAGWDADEQNAFFKTIRSSPEAFVNYFMAGDKNLDKGLLATRAAKKYMEANGMQKEWAELGKTLVFKALERNNAFVETSGGIVLDGARFHKALFKDFGGEKLRLALGEDTAKGLEVLAQVMEETNPAKKVFGKNFSQEERGVSYIANKAAFFLTSAAGGAAAGTNVGAANVAGTAVGMGAGIGILVPLYNVVNRMVNNPAIAKGFYEASMGNTTALNGLMRTFVSGGRDQFSDHTQKPSTPSSRLPILPLVK